MRRMIGRILAWCGWLAWQVGRPFRASPLRRLRAAPVVALAVLLVIAAAVPIVVALLDPQPEDVIAQQLFDHDTIHPEGWLRLQGRMVTLDESPTGERGRFALLVDAANPLRAHVVRGEERLGSVPLASVSGMLTAATVLVDEELPRTSTSSPAARRGRAGPERLRRMDRSARPAARDRVAALVSVDR